MSLIDAINELVAERDQAATEAQTAAGIADKVNAQLRAALDAIQAALPQEDAGEVQARKPRVQISDARAAEIREHVEKFLAGAKRPTTLEAIGDALVEAGVIHSRRRNLPAIAVALENSSLALIEGEGYLPASAIGTAPVAQAAE